MTKPHNQPAETGQPASEPAGNATGRKTLHLAGRCTGAILAGASLTPAFAPTNWWPFAIVSATAFTLLLWRQTWKAAAAIGFVYGLTISAVAARYLLSAGYDTWIVMSLLAAAFFIPQAVATVTLMRLRAWPLLVPFTWTLQELPQATLIFDGFPWIRLGLTQIDAPWSGIYTLGGIPLASVAVGYIAATAAAAVIAVTDRPTSKPARNLWPHWKPLTASVTAAATLAGISGAAILARTLSPDSNGTTIVAVIQGNIDPDSPDGREWYLEITRAHIDATRAMWQQVEQGTVERPDIILWPENSLDFAPDENVAVDIFSGPEGAYTVESDDTPVRALLDQLTADIPVPIIVGYSQRVPTKDGIAATQPDGPLYNRMQLWTAQGGGDFYNKRSLFTFGEYVPWRGIFEKIIGEERLSYQVDLTHGTDPGVITYTQTQPDGSAQDVTVALTICFEIGVDFVAREAVAAGGQYLALGTNSFTWRNTDAPEQQFTAARIRAIETNRDTVVAGVTGPSGLITRDGTVAIKSQANTPQWFVTPVNLTEGDTPAVTWGQTIELAMFLLAIALTLATAATLILRTRRASDKPEETQPKTSFDH